MQGILKFAGASAIVLLAACTSGQSAVEPTVSGAVNIATAGKLQFAVGVAVVNRGVATVTGLNTVTAYRTSAGLAAVLLDTPVIAGPPGFTVPTVAGCAAPAPSTTGVSGPNCPGTDAGTNSITGSLPPAQPVGQQVAATTFGVTGGVFAYGFQPANTTNQNITLNEAGGSRFVPFPVPFYDAADSKTVVGGPPAYVNYRDGTFPTPPTFNGFNQGFVPFIGTTLATGTYNLTLTIPQSPTQNVAVTTSATLNSTVSPFGSPFAAPGAIVRDGAGGFSVPIVVPLGVTETIVDIADTTSGGPCHINAAGTTFGGPYFYSVVVRGTGAQVAVLPPNVGPIDTTGNVLPSVCTGDALTITAYGFDYPAYESGVGLPGVQAPPQTATLTGANGQADVTISPGTKVTY